MERVRRSIIIMICLASFNTYLMAQNKTIIVGSIESNLYYRQDRLDPKNPYVGLLHFIKLDNVWQEVNLWDSNFYSNFNILQDVNFMNNGKIISTNSLRIDTLIDRVPYHFFPYKLSTKNFIQIGKPKQKYSWTSSYKFYRPQIFSNVSNGKRNFSIRKRRTTIKDTLIVRESLVKLANQLKLGNIKDLKLIGNKYETLVVNDTCRIVNVDVNLNMICFDNNIPFDDSTGINEFMLSSMDESYPHRKKTTEKCFFLIHGGFIKYLGRHLTFFDNKDLDDDKVDEILFREDDGHNYTGYVLVTDKLSNFYKSGWGYH